MEAEENTKRVPYTMSVEGRRSEALFQAQEFHKTNTTPPTIEQVLETARVIFEYLTNG